MFRVFRWPAFTSVWLGQVLSQLGTQLFFIMAYWELQLRSPYLLSAAGLALTLPNLLSAVGGSLVDRWDARYVMLWTDIVRAGWHTIARIRWYVAVLPIIVLLNFFFAGVDVLMSVWTHRVLHGGALEFGSINAALSLGQLLGSLCAGLAARMSARTGLLTFGALTSLLMLGFSLSRFVWLSLAMNFVLGASLAIINAIGFALMQRAIPEEVRGRAFGLIYSFAGVAIPLASGLAGASLRVVPVAAWMWLCSASCAALIVDWWRVAPKGAAGGPASDVAQNA